MLIYISREEKVGKNRVLKAIEMGFVLLNRRNKLVIFALTSFAANDIGKNMVHIALGINNWARKNYQAKNNTQ